MHKPTTITLTITTIAALSAIAATMATAAQPEFLPANGKFPVKFTSFAGPGELKSSLATIQCKKETDKGEIINAKEITDTIDFEKCSLLGSPMHSLGDTGETILTTVTGTLCFIKKASPLEVGLLITPTAKVHIEIPGLGTLISLEGSITGLLTPINVLTLEFRLLFKEANGKQSPAGCEGLKESLKVSANEGTPEAGILINHLIIGLLGQTATLDG